MKRNKIAILLIAAIVFSFASWIIYNQINQAQDLTTRVEISKFEWKRGSEPKPDWDGIFLRNIVNITIKNNGYNNASGLTLTVKVICDGNEVSHSSGFTKNIDVLSAGESLDISDWVYSYVSFRPNGTECVSTLLHGSIVLDNRIDPIIWD